MASFCNSFRSFSLGSLADTLLNLLDEAGTGLSLIDSSLGLFFPEVDSLLSLGLPEVDVLLSLSLLEDFNGASSSLSGSFFSGLTLRLFLFSEFSSSLSDPSFSFLGSFLVSFLTSDFLSFPLEELSSSVSSSVSRFLTLDFFLSCFEDLSSSLSASH